MLGYKPINQDRQPLPGLNLWPTSTCLISSLAEILASASPAELQSTAIIVPTKRLGTYLLANLAKRFGAFIPPKIQTLESFVFNHAPAITSDLRIRVASDLEEALVLAGLLEKNRYKHLRPYHEHEITHLFAEIIKEGLEDQAFTNLEQALGKDIYKSEAQLNSLGERLLELKALHQEFYTTLAELGLQTSARAQVAAVEQFLKNWQTKPGLGYGQIYMLGFTSVAKVYHPLLAKLAAFPRCQIWLSQSPELLGTQNPLKDLCANLGPHTNPVVAPSPKGTYFSQSFENIFVEVSKAFTACRQLLDHKKLTPSEIALLVTNEGDYAPILRRLSEEMGFGDANIALEMPLTSHGVGSWLSSFFEFIESRAKIPALVTWLLEPPTIEWARKRFANELGATAFRSLLVESLSSSDSSWDLADLSAHLKDSPLLATIKHVTEIYQSFEKTQRQATTLSEVFSLFKNFFNEFEFSHPEMKLNEKSLALAAEASVKDFFATLTRLGDGGGKLLPKPSAALSFLKTRLLQTKVRSIGEPLCGVQILSLQEARYFPFKAVFILGANEGNLPKSLPKDELLDDYLKRAMGFPGWQALQAREELTLLLLKDRLPFLGLLHSRQQLGQQNLASGFSEGLNVGLPKTYCEAPNLGRNDPLWLAPVAALASQAKGIFSKEGSFQGNRDELFGQMSASSLESLIKCPYRFLLQKLKVTDFVMPSDDPDPRKEGEWLHQVLDHFFVDWPDTDFNDESFYDFAIARLCLLSEQLGPKKATASALFLHLERFSWPRFSRHLIKIAKHSSYQHLTQTIRELRIGFKDEAGTMIDLMGRKVRLVGVVDQVMPLGDAILLTDYKRRALPQQKEVKDCVSPQLSFYSLCLEHLPGRELLRNVTASKIAAGYWSILNGEWQTAALGGDEAPQVFAKKIGAQSRTNLGDLIKKMQGHWHWRISSLEQADQNFFADQSACQNCNYENVCRKKDSRYFNHLEGQKHKGLADHLQMLEDKPT